MPRTPRAIELREITTDADWDAVMGLDRGHGPVHHSNAIDDIRLEAAEEARAMPKAWAVHDAATGDLVGFVMISDNIPEPMDDDLVGPYFLWKLLIDGPRCSDSPARPFFDAETLDGGWAMAPPDGLWGAKSKGSTPSRGTRLLDAAVARS